MGEVSFYINDLYTSAPVGTTLLEAVRSMDIEIPTLCHHPDLKSEGQCRLCLVEIGDWPQTRLVNSCTYPVEKGLKVQTHSENVLQARRLVLELLLARAPKAEIIQKLAAEHGISQSRFTSEDPEELCILCGLCVRTCRDIVGVSAIGMINRTPAKMVSTPFKEPSEVCIGCGSCAFVCPTGVITYTEKNGIRSIWGRDFELVACETCGSYIAPRASLEYWAKQTGDPVERYYICRNCR